MELYEAEYYINQILSGLQHFNVGGRFLSLRPNTSEDRFRASKIALDILKSKNDDIYDNETILDYLRYIGLWNSSLESKLKATEKEIENTLVTLYNERANLSYTNRNRLSLEELRAERLRLLGLKHCYDHLTIEYLAASTKHQFLIGAALYEGSKKYWRNYTRWNKSDRLLDDVVGEYYKTALSYSVYRELSRTEPWTSIWYAHKSGSPIFPCSCSEMTESQLLLVGLALRLDSLYQHPDCPSEKVIQDDDMLDGWYIIQHRKRKEEKGEGVLEKIKDSKVAGCDEIFIKPDNLEELREIYDLNSPMSKHVIYQRNKQMKERGEVNDYELTDIRQKVQMEINKGANRV